jgi:hypothetical protein
MYVRGWVILKAIVRPERSCQWKIPITPPGIETATFRLVAQCLHQLHYKRSWWSSSVDRLSNFNRTGCVLLRRTTVSSVVLTQIYIQLPLDTFLRNFQPLSISQIISPQCIISCSVITRLNLRMATLLHTSQHLCLNLLAGQFNKSEY